MSLVIKRYFGDLAVAMGNAGEASARGYKFQCNKPVIARRKRHQSHYCSKRKRDSEQQPQPMERLFPLRWFLSGMLRWVAVLRTNVYLKANDYLHEMKRSRVTMKDMFISLAHWSGTLLNGARTWTWHTCRFWTVENLTLSVAYCVIGGKLLYRLTYFGSNLIAFSVIVKFECSSLQSEG